MCHFCGSYQTQHRGVRRGKEKYFCTHWFQVNWRGKRVSKATLALLHLDGISFRTLADEFNLSMGTVYAHVIQYFKNLPHCADITRAYCSRFCGVIVTDGKFLRIKGFERKIPVIYGLDYETHDIPTYLLAVSESYRACVHYFGSLKLLNYPLLAVVADENINIFEACTAVYPKAIHQLC